MSNSSNPLDALHYVSADPATVAEAARNASIASLHGQLARDHGNRPAPAAIVPLRAGGRG